MFDLFRKRNVTKCAVTIIHPVKIMVELNQGDILLETLLQRGIRVPYNCRVGACKTCKIRVVEGKPKSQMEREYVLSKDEIRENYFLACQTRVESDMVIEWGKPASNAGEQERWGSAELRDIQKRNPGADEPANIISD